MVNSTCLLVLLFTIFVTFSVSAAHQKNETTANAPSPTSSSSSNCSASINASFAGSFSKVYAFGDSYTDTGNAFILGGIKSFIKDAFAYYRSSKPSAPSLGSRLCNGRLVVDFLCDALSIPYLTPYKQPLANFSHGANFAIAGSTALSSDFFTKTHDVINSLMWQGVPLSFQTQIDWFNKLVQQILCQGKSDSDCKSEIENGLFWIGDIGGNDYARTLGSTVSLKWVTEQTITHISNLLQTLLERGAKYVVVQGLPPIGCCPLVLSQTKASDRDAMGCVASANSLIVAHNALLQQLLARLREQYPDRTIAYADYFNAYKTVLSNLKKYNFVDPFKTCCGSGGGPFNFRLGSLCGSFGTLACKNPGQFIHWDGIHFTEAMHKQLADLVFHQGFCSPSFDELVKIKMGVKSAKVGAKVTIGANMAAKATIGAKMGAKAVLGSAF